MERRASRDQGAEETKGRVSGQIRAGLPAGDSVREVVTFTAGSKVYRILKTTERDAYDPPPPRPKTSKKGKKKKSKKGGR